MKLAVLVALLVPAGWVGGRAWLGALGPQPLDEALHETGLWTVRLLLVVLAMTPMQRLAAWPRLAVLRRMIGVAAALYGGAHLSLYILEENGRLLTVASEIVLRFYLTIGFIALLGLAVLAITSTDGWLRRLGRGWKRLHRIVYVLMVLALWHAFLQSKADVTEATLMAGLFGWLLLWRLLPLRIATHPLGLLALAPAAGVLTAALEYAWFALATQIPPLAVLKANLDIRYGLRPALWVVVAGLAVAVLAALWRWMGPQLRARGGRMRTANA